MATRFAASRLLRSFRMQSLCCFGLCSLKEALSCIRRKHEKSLLSRFGSIRLLATNLLRERPPKEFWRSILQHSRESQPAGSADDCSQLRRRCFEPFCSQAPLRLTGTLFGLCAEFL